MIFVIIIAHAAQKSQHNFRFFRPAAADERLPLTRELSAALPLTEGETGFRALGQGVRPLRHGALRRATSLYTREALRGITASWKQRRATSPFRGGMIWAGDYFAS